jgi:hypothetical protein
MFTAAAVVLALLTNPPSKLIPKNPYFPKCRSPKVDTT